MSYVVTAQRATAVRASVTGNFTSPTHLNLIVQLCLAPACFSLLVDMLSILTPLSLSLTHVHHRKETRIEIFLVTDGGLQILEDVPVNGRIASMQLFRPEVSLFVSIYIYISLSLSSRSLN